LTQDRIKSAKRMYERLEKAGLRASSGRAHNLYDTNRVTQWKGEKLNELNTSTDAFYILEDL
jgi:hypothetical protein